MERRRAASAATLERWRTKTFCWRDGITCVHLARQHLKNMGHKPPAIPRIRSPLAARRALAQRGWAGTAEMLDSLLPRIAPAAMLLGDLVAVPGEDGLDAILVCIAPHKLAGFREGEAGLCLIDVDLGEISACWRC